MYLSSLSFAAGWDVDDDDLELPPDLDPGSGGGGAAAKGEDGEDEGSVLHQITEIARQ